MSKRFASLKPLGLFWRYWLIHPGLFLGALCIGPVLAVQNVVTPLFAAIALSQLIKHGHVSTTLLLVSAIVLLLSLSIGYFVNIRFDARVEHHVEGRMYNDIFRYLVYQDYDFFANNFTGSIVTKANRLVKAYSIFHVTFFLEVLPQLCAVAFVLVIMLIYSLSLGVLVLVLWLISVSLISYLAIKRMPLRRLAVAKDSVQTGELADAVTNAIAVKTFASETAEIKRYARTNTIRGELFLRSWKRAVMNGWVVEVLCAILQLVVFIGGIIAVEHHRLSLPVFLLFQVYILRVVDSLRRTNQFVRTIEGVLGDAIEMTELLEQPPIVQDDPAAKPMRVTEGDIVFDNVVFQYQDNQTQEALFNQLNLVVNRDKKIGLVGPSGGGKTTITKLILRFMDIQGGQITIDGHDIRSIMQQDLREAIAYVPQEPLLFHRTISENIGYGKPGASSREIETAAKLAYADDFIRELPKGYDTLVGERGVKLSGGQRQRIAIARAMLKDAPVLILDEATSALDSDSERLIQKALEKLMENRTVIVIAHRLSTINKLDRIIVLDNGRIVEDGSHGELLEHNGLYTKLWNHQSGGFIEE